MKKQIITFAAVVAVATSAAVMMAIDAQTITVREAFNIDPPEGMKWVYDPPDFVGRDYSHLNNQDGSPNQSAISAAINEELLAQPARLVPIQESIFLKNNEGVLEIYSGDTLTGTIPREPREREVE